MQTFQHPLTPEEETHYLNLYQEENPEARKLLIEHNMRLVAHIVKKYHTPERDMEDLISIGTIGLIKAINTFDASKGSRLGTYASRCIENELLMFFRQERKSSKDISLYDPIGADKEGNEIQLIDIMDADSEDILEEMIKQNHIALIYLHMDHILTPREKDIISKRYGLYGHAPMTQQEIARELHISRSYVSRIEKRALEKLRQFLEEQP